MGVYDPHYDPLVIAARIESWRVHRLLVDKGSGSSILFGNCFKRMELYNNHIYEEVGNVYGFDIHKSHLIERVSMDVMLIGKMLTVDFLLMICKSPYNV